MNIKKYMTSDWFAVFFGVIGSLLVTVVPIHIRFIGFVCFFTANLLWLYYSKGREDRRSIFYLNLAYGITSFIGLINTNPCFW